MFPCPQCNKSYRRRSHLLRHEHNQPPPAAARPGRKKQSCDECFSAKAACDKKAPCSRCQSLGKQCSFRDQSTASPGHFSELSPPSPPPPLLRGPQKKGEPFFFLSRFTDPSVKQDKLAIAETARSSTKRNLDPFYFQPEDMLFPPDSIPNYTMGFSVADIFLQPPPTLSEHFSMSFLPESTCSTRLSTKLNDIMIELAETSRSMEPVSAGLQNPLDTTELASLFTANNLSTFISAFFQSLHWHLPIVHFPTFDPGMVSNPLLLSIFLSGATYATSQDGNSLATGLLDVAEEYIFRQLANLSTTPSPTGPAHLLPTLEVIQGALIVEMLQFGHGETGTRRRIRIIRHPCVISTIRSLGIFQSKRSMALGACDEATWRSVIAEEVSIRIACWAFLADGFLTVCFNNHPALSIFEMDCDFPWSSAVFEAENASSFNEIASAHTTACPLPSLREFITRLLDENAAGDLVQWSRSLVGEHFLILIYGKCVRVTLLVSMVELSVVLAMHSLAFQARSGLFGWISTNTIKRAAENWRSIWDSLAGSAAKEKAQQLGYPKHAEELWLLLTATLDRTSGRGMGSRYLENAATDDLANLNDFIRNIAAPDKT
ncbi:hypothetical protein BO70DRAFT_384110 [Aspergillus heteromorphus CBS 117.55]|uniref:Zn(2)-C6 fungal-type domain-containing protein n=1 Tax=Aspergillus heteromorphus CBS 117.55 TaxID=1448321 RepID=A0A317X251_9EURO|nr:uncharacterized protein BO70DRAFT_384110 [Aspergillus heteromorphus CBS 117.55]PWY92633.1 hypothetical protein BO70DRAFT_384110 [Aspergillus heteromorphus CBS 117.55]